MADSYINVDAAIKAARDLLKEQESLHKRIGIVRTDLRNAVELKAVTAEQAAFVRQTFPIRVRTRKAKA